MIDFWYRFEDYRVSGGINEFGEPDGPSYTEIRMREFQVTKYTPKGVWLHGAGWDGGKKFVLRDARKRYACPTIEEAGESFLARKKRQLSILISQSQSVREAINKFEGKEFLA